ncbi:MFS transporter [Pelagicoccus sp. SDUM812003]|uniref:MFS transporter n=1 Tax=Pelagicoccus sp. SDUM812003 TaxID=3041267 RepID=UPI00280FE785|nr:MFS transporter [Pelagicoccus sp. SDUM812003]MDQ8202881.1 MFS transporter [Pelagicoccus sp. SDUM812003]
MNVQTASLFSYRLILAQALNAFGDHGAKIVASSLVAASFPERQAALWVGVISFLYLAPYVLCAPLAGRLARRHSKARIVKASFLFQAAAMGGLAIGAYFSWFGLMMFSVSMVAIQSCFLAPARNALLRDLCGPRKIGQMMGLIGLAGVGATLAGLAIGGWSFDLLWSKFGTPWRAASVAAAVAALVSLLAFVVSSRIRSSSETKLEQCKPFRETLRELAVTPGLRWPSLGLAWFYGVGAMLVMILLQDGRWEHGQGQGAASQGGFMAALLGAGVALGSGLAACLCRKRVELGLSFLGAIGLMLGAPLTAMFWHSDLLSIVGVAILGLAGGLFATPLNAAFVSRSPSETRSASIAANNLVINLVSGGFVGLASILGYLAWSPVAQLWVVAATTVLVVVVMIKLIPEGLLRVALVALARVLYPTRVKGLENLPESGGALIVANHVSFADAVLIYAAVDRPVRFVGTDELLKKPLMRWVYRRFNVIAVSPSKAKDAIAKTVRALKEDKSVVCIFPEGALTRTGMLMPFKKGTELIARMAQAPVIPAYIDGMWGSVFSFAGEPFRYRLGMPMRRSVRIGFGAALLGEDASSDGMRDAVMQLGYECFCARPELRSNLGYQALKALRSNPLKTCLVDYGLQGRKLKRIELLAAALVVSRELKSARGESRVGVLLPPGVAGCAANLGLAWAGRSSVNLNPTAGSEALRTMIADAGLKRIVTSRRALAKVPGLDLSSVSLLYVEDLLSKASLFKRGLLAALAMALPARCLASVFSIATDGGDREASLLFSSGSSAAPKGIPLTHCNLISNTMQLSECTLMRPEDRILANLPLFHSFGLTGGLWLPLLRGMTMVSTPSPLMAKEAVKAIREGSVSVVLGTPTFLRNYLKRGETMDFSSVRLTVAGAEKLPERLGSQWRKVVGSPILEGYGLTECSPVVSANCLRSEACAGRYVLEQRGDLAGTVGRPLPGVWLRLVSEGDRARKCQRGEAGLIQLKGPNVFRGYLDPSQNEERFTEDGWFDTGDIGCIDENGYLSIEDRVSRFSKIGGEMISLARVEEALERAFPDDGSSGEIRFLVASRSCPQKGEELVLISPLRIDLGEARTRLRALGIPNLWIPQKSVAVERIPLLGTGKLDLKACQQLALAA